MFFWYCLLISTNQQASTGYPALTAHRHIGNWYFCLLSQSLAMTSQPFMNTKTESMPGQPKAAIQRRRRLRKIDAKTNSKWQSSIPHMVNLWRDIVQTDRSILFHQKQLDVSRYVTDAISAASFCGLRGFHRHNINCRSSHRTSNIIQSSAWCTHRGCLERYECPPSHTRHAFGRQSPGCPCAFYHVLWCNDFGAFYTIFVFRGELSFWLILRPHDCTLEPSWPLQVT